MSLAMCVVQNDYIIACSDSAVTYFPFDIDKYKEIGEMVRVGEMEATDYKAEKIHRISNKVLLIAAGKHILAAVLHIELAKRIRESADLIECMAVAGGVLRDLKNGIVRDKDNIIEHLTESLQMECIYDRDVLPSLSLLEKEDYKDLSAYLVGFTGSGKSGQVDILSGSLTLTPDDSRKGYPLLIAGHADDFNEDPEGFSKYQKALIPPFENRNFETFMDRLVFAHGSINMKNPVNVSSDSNFHFLVKDGDEIVYRKSTIETSEFREQIIELERGLDDNE